MRIKSFVNIKTNQEFIRLNFALKVYFFIVEKIFEMDVICDEAYLISRYLDENKKLKVEPDDLQSDNNLKYFI